MKRKLAAVVLTLVLCLASTATAADPERKAVHLLPNGCTGFVVEDNLLVTIKHCGAEKMLVVNIAGRSVKATLAYNSKTEDGPVVYRLEGGPYPSLPVSATCPKPGDLVYSLGYPSGYWSRSYGQTTGSNKSGTENYTNHRINPGCSGGPLLNAKGEVIGVAMAVAEDLHKNHSVFAGWGVTTKAINTVKAADAVAPSVKPVRASVVVFTTEPCGYCVRLEKDVKDGHFADYDVIFVKYDQDAGTWDQPSLYAQFMAAAKPAGDLVFPTIWVQGTQHYRVGYAPDKRPGILGWLERAVKFVVSIIAGDDSPAPVPMPAPSMVSEPGLVAGLVDLAGLSNQPTDYLGLLVGPAAAFLRRRYAA